MYTYWLIGQDGSRKKEPPTDMYEQTIPDLSKSTARSSMKQSNILTDSCRTSTQESPKKLRFAPENSITVCDKHDDAKDIVQSCNSLDVNIKSMCNSISDSDFQPENNSLLTLSQWCLVSKRNSCPCLMDNCNFCCRKQDLNAEKIISSNNKSDLIVSELYSLHKQWGKVGKLASIVSHLEEKYVVVYDKLSTETLRISHSESEPYLSKLSNISS